MEEKKVTKPGAGLFRRIMALVLGVAGYEAAIAVDGPEVSAAVNRSRMQYLTDQTLKRRNSRGARNRRAAKLRGRAAHFSSVQSSIPNPLKRQLRHNGFKRNYSGWV